MKKYIIENGIDRLELILPIIKGKKLGLITNPTGVNKELKSTADILNEHGNLCCLFAPEHGIRGDLQAGEHFDSYTDTATGLPVYSLYGGSVHISSDVMNTLDMVIYDIQDVGARFYTYMYTLSYVMEDCAKAGKEVLVLDRINPLGGMSPEGTVLDTSFSSFVGRFPLATRYGLTIGEYANYINEKENINCMLTVIPVEGWQRDCLFQETDLSWVSPSPNLPTPEACFCYIGTCLLEGTNLSEGRGTTHPFETIGAPWLRAQELVTYMNNLNLPGVKFRFCCFTPTFSKHAGQLCRGMQLHITNCRTFNPFKAGLHILDYIRNTHTEFEFTDFIDLLLGTDSFRKNKLSPEALIASQKEKLIEYTNNIKDFYLYQ